MVRVFASAFAEPEAEAGEEDGGDGELERERCVGGGEKGFEGPGDDEQGDGSGEETDGFRRRRGRVRRAAEHSGEEEAGGEAETGTASDEDTGEFERAVSGDKAPHHERHVMLCAGCGDDYDAHAVVNMRRMVRAREDAACVGVEADGDIVVMSGWIPAFGGEDRVGPHWWCSKSCRSSAGEHGVHELRTRDCQEGSEKCAGEEDGEAVVVVGQEAAEDSGIP